MNTGWTGKQSGFSLVEVLIVVGIIAIMAAVALPNIGQYIRNYKIRGATQEVSGEISAARTKAIMTNTNNGVSFVIVDSNTYRYLREDAPTAPVDERLGPLRDLPTGVFFQVATTLPGSSFRYQRLGNLCKPGAAPCANAAAPPWCSVAETARCNQTPGNYMTVDPANGVTVTLVEAVTGLQRTIRVSPGGRVQPQQ